MRSLIDRARHASSTFVMMPGEDVGQASRLLEKSVRVTKPRGLGRHEYPGALALSYVVGVLLTYGVFAPMSSRVLDEVNLSAAARVNPLGTQGSMPGSVVWEGAAEEEPYDVPDVVTVRIPRKVLAVKRVAWRPGTLPRRKPTVRMDLIPREEDA